MSTITSQTFEPAIPLGHPAIAQAAAELDRRMPRNMGYRWLISAAQYDNRTEVRRYAQSSFRDAYQSVLLEAKASPAILHWRLIIASDGWGIGDLERLRALAR